MADRVAVRLALTAALRALPERQAVAQRLALGEPAPHTEPHKEASMNQPFDITVGDRRRGRVHAIVPFGAFVEIDGRHGLLHRDELGVTALEVGQQVEVAVIAVESTRERFSLPPAFAA